MSKTWKRRGPKGFPSDSQGWSEAKALVAPMQDSKDLRSDLVSSTH